MKRHLHRHRRRDSADRSSSCSRSLPSAMIAMVGLVLDGGGTFVQRRIQQNAADLASLAGANAWILDTNTATRDASAIAAARAVATQGGYTDGVDGATVTVIPAAYGDLGSTVQVDIGAPHDNAFGSIVGMPTWGVSTTATAITGPGGSADGPAPVMFNVGVYSSGVQPNGIYADPAHPYVFGDGNGDVPEQPRRHRLDRLRSAGQRQQQCRQEPHRRLRRRPPRIRLRRLHRPAQPGQSPRNYGIDGPVQESVRTSSSPSSTTPATSWAGGSSTSSSAQPGSEEAHRVLHLGFQRERERPRVHERAPAGRHPVPGVLFALRPQARQLGQPPAGAGPHRIESDLGAVRARFVLSMKQTESP